MGLFEFLFPKRAAARIRLASAFNDVDTLKRSLNRGIDIDFKGEFGMTALMHASASRTVQSMDILIENGSNVNKKDEFGCGSLHYAIVGMRDMRHAYYKIDSIIFNQITSPLSRNPAIDRAFDAITLLCNHNVDLESIDMWGFTPLIWAVHMDSGSKVVKPLVEAGAKTTNPGRTGMTPFRWALETGKESSAQTLRDFIDSRPRTA